MHTVIFIFIMYFINFFTIVAFTSGTSSSFDINAQPFAYANPNINFGEFLKKVSSRKAHDDSNFDAEFPVLTSLPISLNDLGSHLATYHTNKFEDQYLVSVYI